MRTERRQQSTRPIVAATARCTPQTSAVAESIEFTAWKESGADVLASQVTQRLRLVIVDVEKQLQQTAWLPLRT